MLYHYDLKLSIIVEIEANDFPIGTILSQKEEMVQLVAFYSNILMVIKLNYNIYDIEMFAIVSVFKE
jgi:hypothetical protein